MQTGADALDEAVEAVKDANAGIQTLTRQSNCMSRLVPSMIAVK